LRRIRRQALLLAREGIKTHARSHDVAGAVFCGLIIDGGGAGK